jgi:hypothetical protein
LVKGALGAYNLSKFAAVHASGHAVEVSLVDEAA